MKNKIFYFTIAGFALLISACSTDTAENYETNTNLKATKLNASSGATQISGVGYFAALETCNYSAAGADFALQMTGDLEGCLFVYVDTYECSPSGTYRESGREYFVGTYNGESGTFWTTYKFEAKYEGCSEDGFFLGAEIFGRCQHPLVKESGTGVFDGATGRLNFKDNVVDGSFPYKGHLRY